jgi:hypothetical protein
LNPLVTRIILGGAARIGFPNAARMAAEAMGGGVIACIATGYCSEADDSSESASQVGNAFPASEKTAKDVETF